MKVMGAFQGVEAPAQHANEIHCVYGGSRGALPDLLAGKLHAVLFRSWGSRVKGRDWYDLAWYAGTHPAYNLRHLERRARQSGDYSDAAPLTDDAVHAMLAARLDRVDLAAAAEDVRPFLRDPNDLSCWSREFFSDVFRRLRAAESGRK